MALFIFKITNNYFAPNRLTGLDFVNNYSPKRELLFSLIQRKKSYVLAPIINSCNEKAGPFVGIVFRHIMSEA